MKPANYDNATIMIGVSEYSNSTNQDRMKYPNLYRAFRTHISLSEEAYLDLENRLIIKTISKKELLFKEGQVVRYLPFINKGLRVNYRVDDEGEQHVIQIRWAGLWLGDLYSFFSGTATRFNIRAYQDAELLMINQETFDFITKKHPIYEKFFRVSIQNAYVETLNRIYNLHSAGAEDRCLELIHNVPSLLNDIPHYLIASYLSIKPQSLSRIRKTHK